MPFLSACTAPLCLHGTSLHAPHLSDVLRVCFRARARAFCGVRMCACVRAPAPACGSGMRACTASLITLCHEDSSSDAPAYRGEVEFLTEAEWAKELPDLLDDLTMSDGASAGRVQLSVDEDSPAYPSLCRLRAVYGNVFRYSRVRSHERTGPDGRAAYDNPTVDELKAKLLACRTVTSCLGSVKQVTAQTPYAFKRSLEAYMDSKPPPEGRCRPTCLVHSTFGQPCCGCASCHGAHWPLVKQVRLYSRKWTALRTGAMLVDAPGVHDDNSARGAVVKTYLKEADAVWIVSNIVRAVNDKTAKVRAPQVALPPPPPRHPTDRHRPSRPPAPRHPHLPPPPTPSQDLLGEQFRRQMLMDGQFGALAFVATQSDVLERSDTVRALGLPAGTSLSECAARRNEFTRYAAHDRAALDWTQSTLALCQSTPVPRRCHVCGVSETGLAFRPHAVHADDRARALPMRDL